MDLIIATAGLIPTTAIIGIIVMVIDMGIIIDIIITIDTIIAMVATIITITIQAVTITTIVDNAG